MSKKFSAARKRAFLTYLAQTGNQTMAAERAGVSRSWLCLHRANDAGFDAACRAAIERARVELEAQAGGGMRSAPPQAPLPSGRGARHWRYLDGVELVVRGTGGAGGGKRVQIARARPGQWTARVEERFLAALAGTCNVTAACAQAGMSVGSAYARREAFEGFARRWAAAAEEGYQTLETLLAEAACNLLAGPRDDRPPLISGMTADQAMQALWMHQRAVRGLGKRPGREPQAARWAEVEADMMRRLGALRTRLALAGHTEGGGGGGGGRG